MCRRRTAIRDGQATEFRKKEKERGDIRLKIEVEKAER